MKRDLIKPLGVLIASATLLISMAACTSTTITKTSEITSQASPEESFTWSDEASCSSCHAVEAKSTTNPSLLAAKHQSADIVCIDCHDSANMQTVHQDVISDAVVQIRAKSYPQSLCLNCHLSYSDLMGLTENSKAFIDVNNRAINPHDTHRGKIDCNNCHKVHRGSPLISYCYGCHHTGELTGCTASDCHSNIPSPFTYK